VALPALVGLVAASTDLVAVQASPPRLVALRLAGAAVETLSALDLPAAPAAWTQHATSGEVAVAVGLDVTVAKVAMGQLEEVTTATFGSEPTRIALVSGSLTASVARAVAAALVGGGVGALTWDASGTPQATDLVAVGFGAYDVAFLPAGLGASPLDMAVASTGGLQLLAHNAGVGTGWTGASLVWSGSFDRVIGSTPSPGGGASALVAGATGTSYLHVIQGSPGALGSYGAVEVAGPATEIVDGGAWLAVASQETVTIVYKVPGGGTFEVAWPLGSSVLGIAAVPETPGGDILLVALTDQKLHAFGRATP
jgi:hypothetical protein